MFRDDNFHRRDRFCQIIIQIGTILAIFRPFKVLVVFGRGQRTSVDGEQRRRVSGRGPSESARDKMMAMSMDGKQAWIRKERGLE